MIYEKTELTNLMLHPLKGREPIHTSHQNKIVSKKTTTRCLGYRGVSIPLCPGHREVATLQCPGHQGVIKTGIKNSNIFGTPRTHNSLVSHSPQSHDSAVSGTPGSRFFSKSIARAIKGTVKLKVYIIHKSLHQLQSFEIIKLLIP